LAPPNRRAAATSSGRTWAEHDADYQDLERLHRLQKREYLEPIDGLCKAVSPNGELNEKSVRKYCFGDDDLDVSDTYVEAFIRGALDFFREVRHKL
jgi:hypothetical protein